MAVTGKITHKLPLQSGTSQAGKQWSKQEYVLETVDPYPKKVHFDFFGERVNQYPLEVGQMITLSFDIESREYNGKWYTNIRGWKAEAANQNAPAQGAAAQPQYQQAPASQSAPPQDNDAPAPSAENLQEKENSDDLPF